MNNLDTWKYLQSHDYFKNHTCYKNFQLAPEDPELIKKIRNKIMVEIGCGYGRETYYFTKYAHSLYAIDVSNKILEQTEKTIKQFGKAEKIQYVLAEEYKNIITKSISFIYAKHVFQHITPKIAKDYLTYFRKLLVSEGQLDILFRYGKNKNYPIKQEPLIEYTLSELNELFKEYNIIDIISQKGKNYELWRIKANVT